MTKKTTVGAVASEDSTDASLAPQHREKSSPHATISLKAPWRDELPRLAHLDLPLVATGAESRQSPGEKKAPANLRTGRLLDRWPTAKHSVLDIQGACDAVISVGTRTGADAHGLLVFDIDGETALDWLAARGLDPAAVSTWQIHRDTDSKRLKVAFQLTDEQQQELGQIKRSVQTKPGVKEANGNIIEKGEAVELFHQSSSQVIVLGQHYKSKGNYFWPLNMGPEALTALPERWWQAALTIATRITTTAPRCTSSKSSSGDWKPLNDCPICGRNTSGYCSQHKDGKTIRCFHGSTFAPPTNLKTGDLHTDKRGTIWAYSRTTSQSNGDVFSTFVEPDPEKRLSRQKQITAKPVKAKAKKPNQELPASVTGFLDWLPDGWIVDEETGAKTAQGLSAGRFADLMERNSSEQLRFNEMTMFVEVQTKRGWLPMRDSDMDSSYVLLSQKGWKIGTEPMTKAICHVARQKSFHPVRQYLLKLEQDSSVVAFDLDEVAPQFFRSSDPLHVAMVRKWLIGAVSRAINPGCQMDYCLVLQSRDQGVMKTTSFKALASPDWFNSSAPDNDKDFLLNVHSCWIFEMGELECHTGKRSAGHMKNLLTITTDNFRVPYGKNNEPNKRGSVFCGTVNEESFLRDQTGNRRYWVVPIAGSEPLNRDGLIAARDGIWKAAMAAFRAGELPMITRAQEALSEMQNEGFTHSDPWLAMLQASRDDAPNSWELPFSTADALKNSGLKQRDQITKADEIRIAPLLRQMGFEKSKNAATTGEGARARLWSLAQPAQPKHNPNGGGCAAPKRLQGNDSRRLAQPAQPISSKKQIGGGITSDLGGVPSIYVQTGCAGCAASPDPLCCNASEPTQPPEIEVVQIVSVVSKKSSQRAEAEQRIRAHGHTYDLNGLTDAEVFSDADSLDAAFARQVGRGAS